MEKNQIDTTKLRKLIENFKFHTRPSDGVDSNPCTVGDINKVINNVADVLNGFVKELEKFDK